MKSMFHERNLFLDKKLTVRGAAERLCRNTLTLKRFVKDVNICKLTDNLVRLPIDASAQVLDLHENIFNTFTRWFRRWLARSTTADRVFHCSAHFFRLFSLPCSLSSYQTASHYPFSPLHLFGPLLLLVLQSHIFPILNPCSLKWTFKTQLLYLDLWVVGGLSNSFCHQQLSNVCCVPIHPVRARQKLCKIK